MTTGVVDFSRWNNLEWWEKAGHLSRDEAWNGSAPDRLLAITPSSAITSQPLP